MNKQPSQDGYSPPALLIVGLLLGAAFLIYMAWDSLGFSSSRRGGEHVVALDKDNWKREVIDSKIPVVVDFTADWCGPCKRLAPIIDRVATRYKGKVKVGTFDVGDNSFNKARAQSNQYGFRGIPCVMIFKGGENVATLNPPGSEAELVAAIDQVLQ